MPEIVTRLEVDQVVHAFALTVTVTGSYGTDDSFILAVITPPYKWTGGFKLDAAADLAPPAT